MVIPDYCRFPMSLIEAKGYEIYIVGGAVRDLLLGQLPHDFDAATSADPDTVLSIMKEAGIPCINGNGLRHGTVTVLYAHHPFEITTFRTDGSYSDSRHPDRVTFTSSIDEDCRRRDFTINAMYLDKDGNVKDPSGGSADLSSGIIRAVGDPEKRFSEDALRILRGIRFASCLGFTIDPDTAEAMRESAYLLKEISSERILSEITPVILSSGVHRILEEYSDILFEVIPELQGRTGSFRLFDGLDAADEITGFAVLLYGLSGKDAGAVSQRLKFPTALKNGVLTILESRDIPLPEDTEGVRKLRLRYAREDLMRILDIRKAAGEDTSFIREEIRHCEENGIPSSLRELAVGGDDLLSLGVLPGKEVGDILHWLLMSVIEGKTHNDKQELLRFTELLIKEKE